jgi:hypothetical protein
MKEPTSRFWATTWTGDVNFVGLSRAQVVVGYSRKVRIDLRGDCVKVNLSRCGYRTDVS